MSETNKKMYTRICTRCNKPFNTSSIHKKTCHRCVPYNEDTNMYIRMCVKCGDEFESVNPNARYCQKCLKTMNIYQNEPREFTCKICGTKFTKRSRYAKYCDNCLEHATMNNKNICKDNEYFHNVYKGCIRPGSSIDEVAVAAKKAGMSYGKYVQKDYLIKTNNNKITR